MAKITGDELRIIRTLKGLRKLDVAKVLNRYPSAVTYLEQGNRHSLTEEESDMIMKHFDVSQELLWSIKQTIQISKECDKL